MSQTRPSKDKGRLHELKGGGRGTFKMTFSSRHLYTAGDMEIRRAGTCLRPQSKTAVLGYKPEPRFPAQGCAMWLRRLAWAPSPTVAPGFFGSPICFDGVPVRSAQREARGTENPES